MLGPLVGRCRTAVVGCKRDGGRRGRIHTWFYWHSIAVGFGANLHHQEKGSWGTRIYNGVYIALCIASWTFHCLASVQQAMSSCLKEVVSSRNTAPFLLFHSCQQHNATNMLCCCWGTTLILMLEGMSCAANPVCGIGMPKISQNSAAFAHWNNSPHNVFPEEVGSALNSAFDN